MTKMSIATGSITRKPAISRTLQIAAAMLLGLTLIYATGFMPVSAVHNAAHDTRHSQAFPCH